MTNKLYFGDSLGALYEHITDVGVDLDPPRVKNTDALRIPDYFMEDKLCTCKSICSLYVLNYAHD